MGARTATRSFASWVVRPGGGRLRTYGCAGAPVQTFAPNGYGIE
jgi:hypothetical protein